MLEHQTLVGKFLNKLKVPNALKEESYDLNRTVGIDLKSIFVRLTEDGLLGLDTLSSPPRLCTDTGSSQNSSSYRNASVNFHGDDYEILNI